MIADMPYLPTVKEVFSCIRNKMATGVGGVIGNSGKKDVQHHVGRPGSKTIFAVLTPNIV